MEEAACKSASWWGVFLGPRSLKGLTACFSLFFHVLSAPPNDPDEIREEKIPKKSGFDEEMVPEEPPTLDLF